MTEPRPALWFHVGIGKCASRLVANLAAPRDPIWDYESRIPLSYWLHHGQEPAPDVSMRLSALMDGWARDPGPHFVSREPLSGLRWWPNSENFTPETARWIERLCAGRFEVGILMVVRRQDTYFESLYNQEVVDGETKEFGDWLLDRPWLNFEWHQIADDFAAVFGPERVRVLPMERDQLALCGYNNLVEAARATLGFPDWRCPNPTKLFNPSLAPECRELQRQANAFLPPKQRRGLAEWFMANTPHVPGTPHGLFRPSRRADIIDDYVAGNRRLAPYLPKRLAATIRKGLTFYGRGATVPPVATSKE